MSTTLPLRIFRLLSFLAVVITSIVAVVGCVWGIHEPDVLPLELGSNIFEVISDISNIQHALMATLALNCCLLVEVSSLIAILFKDCFFPQWPPHAKQGVLFSTRTLLWQLVPLFVTTKVMLVVVIIATVVAVKQGPKFTLDRVGRPIFEETVEPYRYWQFHEVRYAIISSWFTFLFAAVAVALTLGAYIMSKRQQTQSPQRVSIILTPRVRTSMDTVVGEQAGGKGQEAKEMPSYF